MKNFVSFLDHDPLAVRMIVEDALAIKQGRKIPQNIKDKTLGMLFFNPGYAGRPKFGAARSVAILHCDKKEIRPEFVSL